MEKEACTRAGKMSDGKGRTEHMETRDVRASTATDTQLSAPGAATIGEAAQHLEPMEQEKLEEQEMAGAARTPDEQDTGGARAADLREQDAQERGHDTAMAGAKRSANAGPGTLDRPEGGEIQETEEAGDLGTIDEADGDSVQEANARAAQDVDDMLDEAAHHNLADMRGTELAGQSSEEASITQGAQDGGEHAANTRRPSARARAKPRSPKKGKHGRH